MTKVIHVVHHSLSFALPKERLEIGIFESWAARVGKRVLKETNEFDIECFTPEKSFKNMEIKEGSGITFKIFPSFALRSGYEISLPLLREIKRVSKQEKVILHLHGLHYPFVSLISKIFSSLPVVIQHHGESPFPRIKTFFEPFTLKKVRKVLAVSKAEIEYISRILPKERVLLQGMGVDFNFCQPTERKHARKILNLPQDKKLLLYVGAPYKIKWREMLDAVKVLKEKFDVDMLLIDRGENEMFSEVKRMGGIALAPVPREQMPLYYSAVDAYILNATDMIAKWGGIGIAPVEAAACGTPMVSTNLIHFPNDEWTGIGTIPNGNLVDAIKEVLDAPERFRNCRELAMKHYEWENITKNTIGIYRDIIS
ncbi:MAG: glycosyltransferase family 4 protein [Candidatus Aenigmarchaeota archaeon]|nr:glycosyltransferase family 4 protein [Candidatus Aenigmarchaeota archaeon]